MALDTTELATGSTGDSVAGVDVGEEHGGVLLDLADVETIASVSALHDNTGLEGAAEAANAVAASLGDLDGVGESDTVRQVSFIHGEGSMCGSLPRGTSLAEGSLVDVSGRGGRRLVVTSEAIDGDVVADDVLGGVDAEVEHASAALETTGELVLGVDNLVGAGDNVVGGGEGEGAVSLDVTGNLLSASHRRGLGDGSESENSDGLHGD